MLFGGLADAFHSVHWLFISDVVVLHEMTGLLSLSCFSELFRLNLTHCWNLFPSTFDDSIIVDSFSFGSSMAANFKSFFFSLKKKISKTKYDVSLVSGCVKLKHEKKQIVVSWENSKDRLSQCVHEWKMIRLDEILRSIGVLIFFSPLYVREISDLSRQYVKNFDIFFLLLAQIHA